MPFATPADFTADCDGLFVCLADWAYNVTGGLYFALILIAFAVVLYMATITRFGPPRAFGYASFFGAIASVWLAVLQLLPWWIASLFILTGATGMAVLLMKGK